MIPAVPNLCLWPRQAQPRLVNQRRRLKRLSRWLVGHPNGGQLSQFLIDQREQFLSGSGVALLDGIQQSRHVAHGTVVAAAGKRLKPPIVANPPGSEGKKWDETAASNHHRVFASGVFACERGWASHSFTV